MENVKKAFKLHIKEYSVISYYENAQKYTDMYKHTILK